MTGAKLVFVKNPAYTPRAEPADGLAGGKVAHVDRVEWHILPDQQTRAERARQGRDRHRRGPFWRSRRGREEDEGCRRRAADEIGVAQQIRLNATQPPFDNPKIRQAVLLAVDGQDFLQAVIDDPGLGKVCRSFYVCSSPYFSEEGFPSPISSAPRRLVRESGYDGTPVVLLDAAENANIHAFTMVADQLLRQIGLKTDVQAMDWATVVSRRASREPVGKGGWSIFISGPAGST